MLSIKQCFVVGPTVLSLRDLRRMSLQKVDTTWQVNVSLSKEQNRSFNQMASGEMNRTMTFVVGGVATGQFRIEAHNFDGSFPVIVSSQRDAERVEALLRGS